MIHKGENSFRGIIGPDLIALVECQNYIETESFLAGAKQRSNVDDGRSSLKIEFSCQHMERVLFDSSLTTSSSSSSSSAV